MSAGPGLRSSVVAAKARLLAGRQKIKLRHDQGSPGLQVCHALADLLDGVVLELYGAAAAELGSDAAQRLDEQVALVAHGGYGRRDVAPYSDVDLMILHAPEAAEQVAALAHRLVRDVFDAGLMLGQSVRTIDQACELATGDAAICTSLMESRLLAGSEALFERFFQRFTQQVRRRVGNVMATVEKARREERRQYGETVYLLEPNVKRSQGGLRDVQMLRWIGFATQGVANPDALQACGALAKEDQRLLRQATGFLLHLRNEMHFYGGKANDVLDRAEQVRLASVLGFRGQDGLLPVEEFMREYFRRTSEVHRVLTRFMARNRPGSVLNQTVNVLFSHQVEGDFRVSPTEITPTRRGLAKLKGQLSEILRLCDLANLYDKRLSHAACEAIREAVPGLPDEVDRASAERFLSILSQQARLGELLRLLHDLGVLEKILPAFGHARCLLQFNEYHKYTVDEHSFRAVESAASFFHESGPLGRVYRHIKQKRLLHLALLIHDLGKGYPEDHSEVGRRIAEQTADRLELSPHDRQALVFLVHKHLVMSHLAFRRDTSDEQLVVRFAVEVGSPDVLEMLFVLTAADIAAVGPGTLTQWKIEVLADLFHRTMQHLAGDIPSLAAEESWKQKQQEIRSLLDGVEEPQWYREQIEQLPPSYLHARHAAEIAADLKQLHSLRPGEVLARGRFLTESQLVEYTVTTFEDVAPGVFHKLTGALSAKGLQILSADINTLARGLVLDRFFVLDGDYANQPPQERLENVSHALEQALVEGVNPSFRRVWRSGRQTSATIAPLPTEVRTDNDTSEKFTILDIFTADRLGLLYAISRTLFELGLSVSVAKIGTYLDQVVDVFYVTDRQGRKIADPERLEEIRTRLLGAIEAIERRERETIGA
jgi:[protein-PII] uridylyltransferase